MKSVGYQTSTLLKMLLRGETIFLFRSLRHSDIYFSDIKRGYKLKI